MPTIERTFPSPLVVALAVALAISVAVGAQQPGDPPEPTLGKAASIQADGDWIWLDEGVPLFHGPDAASGRLAVVETRSQLRVLDRRGGWVRVRYGSFTGWFSESATAEPGAPTPWTPAERVLQARQDLDRALAVEPMGPFTVYTDLEDTEVLGRLARIGAQLPAIYRDRFGLSPVTDPTAGSVLLFLREADYREFARRSPLALSPESRGHVTPGLAALYVGDQSETDLVATFVHELVHLLNQAALSQAGPHWIEEGLANDLAFCEIDPAGGLTLASVGGQTVIEAYSSYTYRGDRIKEGRVRRTGAAAALTNIKQRWRRKQAIPLARLTAPEWSGSASLEDLDARYSASAFFVRFLLDGEEGDLDERFRSYLRALASSESPGAAELERHLGLSLTELDRPFASWLEKQRLPRWYATADARRRAAGASRQKE